MASPEKAALMGFPIFESTANSYGCQTLAWDQLKDAHEALGNSMHVPNAAGVLLATCDIAFCAIVLGSAGQRVSVAMLFDSFLV